MFQFLRWIFVCTRTVKSTISRPEKCLNTFLTSESYIISLKKPKQQKHPNKDSKFLHLFAITIWRSDTIKDLLNYVLN